MFDKTTRGPGLLILLFVCVLVCAACTGPTRSPVAPTSIIDRAAHSVVNPACVGGMGTAISVPPSFLQGAGSIATTMLPNGDTLVTTSAGYPSASYVMADAFRSNCARDPSFGSGGVERLVVLGGPNSGHCDKFHAARPRRALVT